MAEFSHTAQSRPAKQLVRPSPRALSLAARGRIARPRLSGRHLLVLAMATLVAIVVTTTISRARTTTSQLGLSAPVVVAIQTIEPGSTLDQTNTAVQQRPVGFVPSLALESAGGGQRSIGTISPGEIITSPRVVGPSGIGVDEEAVLVPTLIQRLDLGPGDLVQVYGLTPVGSADAPISVVAAPLSEGRVLDVIDQAVVVVVPDSAVASILEATAIGAVDLVQRPNG